MATKKQAKEVLVDGIEELLEQLRSIKDQKEELERQTKKINEQEEYVEQLVITKLQSEGLQSVKSANGYGTASIMERESPTVKDWDKVLAWVIKHKRFEFLKKGISSTAWKEAKAEGEVVPGIEPFKKDVLSFRRPAGSTGKK